VDIKTRFYGNSDNGYAVSDPGIPTRGNDVFAGWYVEGETEPFDFDNRKVYTRDYSTEKIVTLVAKYDFDVLDINPNIGPTFGETPMTLYSNGFGTNAGNIASVRIGGVLCNTYKTPRPTPIPEDSDTTYTCAIPSRTDDGGKFDVVITRNDGKTYTVTEGFEYVKATRDPLRANIQ
jgi:hypothetical protein